MSDDTAKGKNKKIIAIRQDVLPRLIKHLSPPEISHQEMCVFHSKILLSSSKILEMVWSDGHI